MKIKNIQLPKGLQKVDAGDGSERRLRERERERERERAHNLMEIAISDYIL